MFVTRLYCRRMVVIMRTVAFAHRTEFGDPAYVNNSAKWSEVTQKWFGRETLKRITDNSTHPLPYYQAKFDLHDDHGTTHLSVVDVHGTAVSLTTTVNLIWGSRVMDPETGIILNDEMDDFATPNVPDAFGLAPSPYNYPEGARIRGQTGKRPLSSMAATIMDHEDGSFWLSLGGSGGSRIFGGIAQTILNLDWGYDLSHAIEEPRVHSQLLPTYVSIESGTPPELIDALRMRGHKLVLSCFAVFVLISEQHLNV
jgi:gamma-glutamyltranspeptidase/glutathione hydrolase/leukotriene-C4 hydrolase